MYNINSHKVFINVILFTLIPLVVLLSACGLVNRSSGYDTNEIEKLQKKVPFTIVVPTYFPNGSKLYLSAIAGPSEEEAPQEDAGIVLTYREQGTDNFIWIIERNNTSIALPSPSSIYLDINGTQVLEEETELLRANPSQSPPETYSLHGLSFDWNRDGVNFQVEIFGYDREECRKVIESMIQPQ